MRIRKESIETDLIKTEKGPVADSCVHGQEIPDSRKSGQLLHEVERLSSVELLRDLTAGVKQVEQTLVQTISWNGKKLRSWRSHVVSVSPISSFEPDVLFSWWPYHIISFNQYIKPTWKRKPETTPAPLIQEPEIVVVNLANVIKIYRGHIFILVHMENQNSNIVSILESCLYLGW
jgi:hypothetical protein